MRLRSVLFIGLVITSCVGVIFTDISRLLVNIRSDDAQQFHPITPLSQSEIIPNSSIFFVETNEELGAIRPRSLCAVESAARANPKRAVFFLISHKARMESFPDYFADNVHFRYLNIDELTKDTPVEKIWSSGLVRSSHFYLSHCSDMLRFLLLWIFGGLYYDQDVLTTKAMPSYPQNFVVSAGNYQYIATAVIRMEKGHPLMHETLQRMSYSFDPYNWVTNGPLLLTNTAEKFCNHSWIPPKWKANGADKFEQYKCSSFKILPPETACPIPAGDYRRYYDPEETKAVKEILERGFAFHYFNKMRTKNLAPGEDEDILVNETQPLYELMKQLCPETEARYLRSTIGQKYE